LARRPGFPVVVAYESAAWQHGLTSRSPSRHVVSIAGSESVPHALRDFRVTRVVSRLEPDHLRGLPVWRLESLLVMIGARPDGFRDWPNIGEWVATAVADLDPKVVLAELEGRPRAAWMRTGYLVEMGRGAAVAEVIRKSAPQGSGPIYLGRRDAAGRYQSKWEVYDSLLWQRLSTTTPRGSG